MAAAANIGDQSWGGPRSYFSPYKNSKLKDGLTWPLETRLTAKTGSNRWAGDGDHDMRTAVCAVREDDGTFTVVYTAKMKDRGFWAVGKCTLAWADLKE
ncbi:MAG: hypothetical protein GY809_19855 [Planctomycetes bacterium]|nr:hypothetical protein [Planctomycetota bacterium]